MKTKVMAIIVVMCGLSLWALPAEAKLITIEIEAVVDLVGDPYGYLEGRINPGDIISGWYTYDTSTPDTNPSPRGGHYEHHAPPCGIFLSSGGFDFQTDPMNVDFLVEIENDHPPDDNYFLLSLNNLPLPKGIPVDEISWWLHDPTGSALSSDALPTTAPVLEDWQGNRLSIISSRTFGIGGYVTSAVPEPTTILLLGLGTMLLRKRR